MISINFNDANLIKIYVNLNMSTKLFKNDKNYILKSVQNDTKKDLLKYLIEISIHKYEIKSNPLGLVDDSIKKLNNYNSRVISRLNFFY